MGNKAHDRLFGTLASNAGTDTRPAALIEAIARYTNDLVKVGASQATIEAFGPTFTAAITAVHAEVR